MAGSSDEDASEGSTPGASGDELAPSAAGGRSGGEAESGDEGDGSASEWEGDDGVAESLGGFDDSRPASHDGGRDSRPASRSSELGEQSDAMEGGKPHRRRNRRALLPHVPGLTVRSFPKRVKVAGNGFRGVRPSVRRGVQFFAAELMASFNAETNSWHKPSVLYRAAEAAARAYDCVQLALFGVGCAITNFPADQYPPEARQQRPAEVPQLIAQLREEAAQHRREHAQQHPDAPGPGQPKRAGPRAPKRAQQAARKPKAKPVRIAKLRLGKRKRQPGPRCGLCAACVLRCGPCLAPALAGQGSAAKLWHRRRVATLAARQSNQLVTDAALLEGTPSELAGCAAATRAFAPFGPPEREPLASLPPERPSSSLTTDDYFAELLAVERARRRGLGHTLQGLGQGPPLCLFCGLRTHAPARCPLAPHLVDGSEDSHGRARKRPPHGEAQPVAGAPSAAEAEARAWLEALPPRLRPAARALGEASRRHEALEGGSQRMARAKWHGLTPPGLAALTLLTEQLLAADAPRG